MNENTYTVYCHTNKINGKKYVGITRLKPENRWLKGTGYKGQVFYKAVEKYGWDNFEHEILFTELSKQDAEYMERKLIKELRTRENDFGYNIAVGGELTSEFSTKKVDQYDIECNFIKTWDSMAEVERKLGICMTGVSSCCREDDAYTAGGYIWAYHGDIPKKKETNKNYASVNRYSIHGKYIDTFQSIMEAERITGVSNKSISNVCRGQSVSGGGYVWRYAHNVDGRGDVKVIRKNKTPIDRYDIHGNLIRRYDSVESASIDCKVSTSSIWSCLNERTITCGDNFVFVFKDESFRIRDKKRIIGKRVYQYDLNGSLLCSYIDSTEACIVNESFSKGSITYSCNNEGKTAFGYMWSYENKPMKLNLKQKPVIQYDGDGNYIAEFRSASEAQRQTGIFATSISTCCTRTGRNKSAGGYVWKFKDVSDKPA